jgi:RNA polymerase sigma-70 factor (ECF subfamily)
MTANADSIEASIRAALTAGNLSRAATLAVEGYGPEVLGYLLASLRSEQDATEVFSMLTEDLWRGLPGFRAESSFRTWLYCLARNAAVRFRRSPQQRAALRQPLSAISEVSERVRTATLPHLRTDVKQGFAKLRADLDADDETLLILRVDRKLSWDEVPMVLCPEEAADPERRGRAAARLRKRMQSLKHQLRERAVAAGLLVRDDDG